MPDHWQMKLHFKTYCNTHNLKEVREFVRDSLSSNGITDPDAYMTVLAVDEICANLMIHSNNCNNDKYIDLVLQLLDNQISITIKDYGLTFNFDEHKGTALDKLVEERRKGGLGLMLVKKIMDEVRYETASGQNCWILLKTLKSI